MSRRTAFKWLKRYREEGGGAAARSEPALASLAPPEPVVRYERSRPGSLVHMDINWCTWTSRSSRVSCARGTGSMGTGAGRSRARGWEYYHAAIDDVTRLAYGEVLASERKEDAVAFLLRVVGFFGRLGVKISLLMTDNGPAYQSRRFRRKLRSEWPASAAATSARQVAEKASRRHPRDSITASFPKLDAPRCGA
ncbi:DDE-type integrase/transposase/recombinase [Candidatus Palauibacter sp.]|uniref:DDE-type integrase/transposase/recombinase n=1 Tax=Candidatus Palauibacter sp. TaxID=3101350 RepID=UPI003C6F25A2